MKRHVNVCLASLAVSFLVLHLLVWWDTALATVYKQYTCGLALNPQCADCSTGGTFCAQQVNSPFQIGSCYMPQPTTTCYQDTVNCGAQYRCSDNVQIQDCIQYTTCFQTNP